MNKWISVAERLPEKHKNVLCNVVNNNNRNIQLVLMRENKTHDGLDRWLANFIFKTRYHEYTDEMPEVPDEMVTHWMDLPEPPLETL